jgi:small GTP-binding protein
VFGLSATDGKTRWVYQRNNPPLTVRNYSGGAITRGGLFMGTAGGKLVARRSHDRKPGWEGNVATPKGATELERIADITSLPLLEGTQACAVAYQGRIACFDICAARSTGRATSRASKDSPADSRYVYVTDDKGAVQALDKTTGASAWKQDKLAQRRPGGPQVVGDYVAVVDGEGIVHLLDSSDGNLSDASRPTAIRRPPSRSNRATARCGKARAESCSRSACARPLPLLPTLVIVGRPNVGKSTLFNRLTRSRAALVADFPGLTRDRHYGRARLGEQAYLVVDTGGFEPVATEGILYEMAKQTRQAIDEAGRRRLLVDARQGVTPQDRNIAELLRRAGKPIAVVANKAEGLPPERAVSEFYELGLGEPHPISSAHGDNVAETAEWALSLVRREAEPMRRRCTRRRMRRRSRLRSSAGRTSASRRSSTRCSAKSA